MAYWSNYVLDFIRKHSFFFINNTYFFAFVFFREDEECFRLHILYIFPILIVYLCINMDKTFGTVFKPHKSASKLFLLLSRVFDIWLELHYWIHFSYFFPENRVRRDIARIHIWPIRTSGFGSELIPLNLSVLQKVMLFDDTLS